MNKNEIKQNLERKILGTMLNDTESVISITRKLKSEDFSEIHSALFESITETAGLMEQEYLVLELSKKNLKSWGLSELMKLRSENYGSTSEKLWHNKVIESLLEINFSFQGERLLSRQLKEIKDGCYGLDSLLNVRDEIDILIKVENRFEEEKDFGSNLQSIASEIQDELNNKNSNSLTLKSIPSFNNATGGMRASNLIGIAGSYKSGKTTLAINVLVDLVKQNIPCGYFSLELSETELNRKILGMLTKVPYEHLREPKKMTEDQQTALSNYFAKKRELPLYISDKPMSELEIRNKAKYWKDRFGVKVIAVDYMGYIRSKRKFDLREREMSYYSEFLKSLAKELDITVIALAQLNRTGRQNPGTENLAESIALARDCDFLFVVYNILESGIDPGNSLSFTESDFMLKLDTTRHTKSKKQIQIRLNEDGIFEEIATEYDNNYVEKYSKKQKTKPEPNYNHYEHQYR